MILQLLIVMMVLFQPLYNRCGATSYQRLAGGELLFAAQDPQDW